MSQPNPDRMVRHPQSQCMWCGAVVYWIGAASHMARCAAPVVYDEYGDRLPFTDHRVQQRAAMSVDRSGDVSR